MKKQLFSKAILAACLLGAAGAAGEAPLPFMVLRLGCEHYSDPALRDELLAALKECRASCDEVWFRTAYGKPPMEAHRKAARQMAEAAAGMRALGIVPSIQIDSTIGHADCVKSDHSGLAWGTFVNRDGVATKRQSCPRQPAFLAYMAEMMTAYASAVRPGSIWLDDDTRMDNHAPAGEGCYCETCIGLFNRQYGYSYTRATLVAALGDAAVNARWQAFRMESLVILARAIAEAVRKVSPETRLALQHGNPGVYGPALRALAEASGHPARVRPGGGFYRDDKPREVLDKMISLAGQIQAIPRDAVDFICPEIERYPDFATGKSWQMLAAEAMVDLSIGENALSFAAFDCPTEPFAWFRENVIAKLAALRPQFEAYAKSNMGTQPAGVAAYRADLVAIGVPFCNIAQKPVCTLGKEILCHDHINGKSAELNGITLRRLSPEEAENASGYLIAKHPFNEGIASRFEQFTFWTRAEFCLGHLPDDAQVIARYRNADGSEGPPVSALCKARDGTRRALFACGLRSDISSGRRTQMFRALDWVSGERLPAWLPDACQAAVFPHCEADGTLRNVGVLNTSIAPTERTRLILRGFPERFRKAAWQELGGTPVMLDVKREGSRAIVAIPPIRAWNFGWIEGAQDAADGR